MASFFSAILSDLTSRSMSFLIDKCSRPIPPPSVEETLNRMQRLLLRVHVIVEEADERHITNQAMLRQLSQLRKELYRGYHTLDTFRCRAHEENDNDHRRVSPSFTASILSPAKRIRFCSSGGSSIEQEQLQQVLRCLESAIGDAREFVVFLSGCPRLCSQPYSMHLLLGKCMFGRQMEMDHIMGFLLQAEAPCGESGTPGVLPIIGPAKVGKSTIIEHACNDERVRNRFSQILRFSEDSIKDERIVTLRDCAIAHRNRPDSGGEAALVIIELIRDIDEDMWRKLYSDCKNHITRGSKIIIASRSDKIARFGTAPALRLKFFTEEAYWYFFRVRTFGSTNMEDHPKLASMAMDIAREMNGCFMGGNVFSGLLGADFNVSFWRMTLAIIKKFKRKNSFLLGGHFADVWPIVQPLYVPRVNNASSEYFVALDDYQTSVQDSDQSEAPTMNAKDFIFGRVKPHGRFKVLVWRSQIPPHYNYMVNCEVRSRSPRKKELKRARADHLVSL